VNHLPFLLSASSLFTVRPPACAVMALLTVHPSVRVKVFRVDYGAILKTAPTNFLTPLHNPWSLQLEL